MNSQRSEPLVVLLRGINVGGHNRLRPSILARKLHEFDVINIDAAGTFVVRNPGGSEAAFRSRLLRELPAGTHVAICHGRDFLRLELEGAFDAESSAFDSVRFVSVLPDTCAAAPSLPISLPSKAHWLVRVISVNGRFIFGEYRRDMKTISHLSKIDALFGASVTTRTTNTVAAILRTLKRTV